MMRRDSEFSRHDLSDRAITICASKMLDRYGDSAIDQIFRFLAVAAAKGDTERIRIWQAVISRITSLRKVRAMLGEQRRLI